MSAVFPVGASASDPPATEPYSASCRSLRAATCRVHGLGRASSHAASSPGPCASPSPASLRPITTKVHGGGGLGGGLGGGGG